MLRLPFRLFFSAQFISVICIRRNAHSSSLRVYWPRMANSSALRFRSGYRRGFTLLELMVAIGLTAMVYAIVTSVTVQLSRTTRMSEEKMSCKAELVSVSEQMRWQIRCLYYPKGEIDSHGKITVPQRNRPTSNTRPPSLGNLGVYSRRGDSEDGGILLMRTASPLSKMPAEEASRASVSSSKFTGSSFNKLKSGQASARKNIFGSRMGKGTAEVGYKIISSGGESFLAYRQYPWVDPLGLHGDADDPNASWRVLSREIKGLRFEFSADGDVWQKEWTDEDIPKWFKVTLIPVKGEELEFKVVAGMKASRW